MLILLLLVSFYQLSAAWICPSTPLGPQSGKFPNNTASTTFAPNQNCSFQIVVQKNTYIKLSMDFNLNIGDLLTVTDNYGMKETYIGSSFSNTRTTFDSAVDIFINLSSGNFPNGFFSFSWNTSSIPNRPIRYLTAGPQDLGPAALNPEDFDNNNIVVTFTAATKLYANKKDSYPYSTIFYAKSYFIFKGNGASGPYLGSIYDLLSGNNFTNFTSSDTITIVRSNSSFFYFSFCMLFKLISEIQNVVYDINCYDPSQTYIEIYANHTKPAALTVIAESKYSEYLYLNGTNITALANMTLNILPGSATPPYPALPYLLSNDSGTQYIPGIARTFVLYGHSSDSCSISLSSTNNYYLYNGDYLPRLIPSRNYPFNGYPQRNTAVIILGNKAKMLFNCLNCTESHPFTIQSWNDDEIFINNALGSGKIIISATYFEIFYPNVNNSGGLLEFNLLSKAVMERNLLTFFVLFIVIFL